MSPGIALAPAQQLLFPRHCLGLVSTQCGHGALEHYAPSCWLPPPCAGHCRAQRERLILWAFGKLMLEADLWLSSHRFISDSSHNGFQMRAQASVSSVVVYDLRLNTSFCPVTYLWEPLTIPMFVSTKFYERRIWELLLMAGVAPGYRLGL